MGEKKNGEQVPPVGLVLRARRREMNMSQASLAEKMQTSQEVISNYENGVTPVRADDLPRFAGILAVTPTYFFEPNQQNKAAAPQFQSGGVQPTNVQFSEGLPLDSRAAEQTADAVPKSGPSLKSAPAPRSTKLKAAAYDALALGAFSTADLEKTLLAYYRALDVRGRTLAVKLIENLPRMSAKQKVG